MIARFAGVRYAARCSATGASRSIEPSSAATITASATSGLVSEASANSEAGAAAPAERVSRIPEGPTTAAATADTSPSSTQVSIISQATSGS